MREEDFIERSGFDLREFERLITKGEGKGGIGLSSEELISFSRFYDRTLEYLNLSRTFFGVESRSFTHINSLLYRAGPLIRRKRGEGSRRRWSLPFAEFSEALRRNRKAVAISALSFLLPAVLGFFLILRDDIASEYLISPPLREHLSSLRDNSGWIPDMHLFNAPHVSTLIMSNNIKVTFLAFGLGIFWGIGTLYILFYNGISFGGVAAATHRAGLDALFWGFVLPHGILELTAIFIAGGAGLILGGWAYTEGRAGEDLKTRARSAGYMILSVIPLLILAGFVEGFISPLEIPFLYKTALSLSLLLLLAGLYILLLKRARPEGAHVPP